MTMIINPDKETRKRVLLEIKATKGYCPCMIEQSEDTMCPCKWKREEDKCVCGLYVIKENER